MRDQSTGTSEPAGHIGLDGETDGASSGEAGGQTDKATGAEAVTDKPLDEPLSESWAELAEPGPGHSVARHYTRSALLSSMLDALSSAGKAVSPLDSDDLSPMDELHTGGRKATERLAELLNPSPGDQVLDLGCGLGGPARYLARHRGCRVVGVDLARENIEVATELTARCGLAEMVEFRQADVTALPFAEASFEAAIAMHVGMNVASKAALCAQTARVLRPGGRFVLYDVMLLTADDADLAYPLPWASNPEISFLEPVAEYRRLLAEAGFVVEAEHDLRELALEQLDRLRELGAENLPPVGQHVVIGESFLTKIGNLAEGMTTGLVAPIQLLATR